MAPPPRPTGGREATKARKGSSGTRGGSSGGWRTLVTLRRGAHGCGRRRRRRGGRPVCQSRTREADQHSCRAGAGSRNGEQWREGGRPLHRRSRRLRPHRRHSWEKMVSLSSPLLSSSLCRAEEGEGGERYYTRRLLRTDADGRGHVSSSRPAGMKIGAGNSGDASLALERNHALLGLTEY